MTAGGHATESCAPVAAMLLEEKIDRLLAKRLRARIKIEREFAELPPGDRLEIDRQYPFTNAARRPCTRRGGLRGLVRCGFGGGFG